MTGKGNRRYRRLAIWIGAPVAIALLLVLVVWIRHGGGEPFPDRSEPPERAFDEIEVVAELDHPPGNVAVSADGRVFVTFHPDGSPPVKVAEIVGGEARPFPSREWQSEREDGEPFFDTPLSLRIDRQGRLWVLDLASHGTGTPRITAFDVASGDLVRDHEFGSDVAPLGSHLNDFSVHPDGNRIYIADASIFRKSPAIVVYDVRTGDERRVLEEDPSVMPDHHVITVEGEPQVVLGIFAIRPGVDSIALDRRGEWLYYAAVTANHFYRVRTRDLDDEALSGEALSRRVERLGEKTESDGITIDDADTLYVSDPEHSAIHTFDRAGRIRTLFADPRLRWPDGFSFGPNGLVYVTCSSLQHVIMKSADEIAAHRPFHVVRFASGATAPPGH